MATKARFVPHVSGFENDGTAAAEKDAAPQLQLRKRIKTFGLKSTQFPTFLQGGPTEFYTGN